MLSAPAKQRLLMVFVDGLGIGRRDASTNPLLVARMPALRSLCGGEIPTLRHRRSRTPDAAVVPLDATLGVDGLPQSGTGQTALFTGINAARHVGRHFGPYPYSTLRPLLQQEGLFARCLRVGKTVCFANAFPHRFFKYAADHRNRLSATTLSAMLAGVPLRGFDDLRAEAGVSADITGAGWHEMGYDSLPVIEPDEAGRRLVRLSGSHDLVLFEYWKTDHAGHAQSMQEAVRCLESLDGLVGGIVAALEPGDTLLCLTSDHGNIEDLSVKTHTRNPVPMILYGCKHERLAERLETFRPRMCSLHHVAPLLMEYLEGTL